MQRSDYVREGLSIIRTCCPSPNEGKGTAIKRNQPVMCALLLKEGRSLQGAFLGLLLCVIFTSQP